MLERHALGERRELRTRGRAWILLASVALIVACAIAGPRVAGGEEKAADVHAWKRYTNVRFRYSICDPADLLSPQDEPDNSDGQVFLAANACSVRSGELRCKKQVCCIHSCILC